MTIAKSDVRVTVTENGPYIVTGSVPLQKQTIGTDADGGSETWIAGKTFAAEAEYALCRCGHSKSKPFCDGSHERARFDGRETASREPYLKQARAFDGPAMRLTRCGTPTARRPGRCSCARSRSARPAGWSPGTRRLKRRSSRSCRSRSAWSTIRRMNAAGRCGCAAAFR